MSPSYHSIQSLLISLLFDLSIPPPPSAPNFHGQEPICPNPHRIGDTMAIALATLATTLTNLWTLRTSQQPSPFSISIENCIPQLMAAFLTTTNGVSCGALMEDHKLLGNNDFFEVKDGRRVLLLTTYPQLRDIACVVLGCASEKALFEEKIKGWNAFELETEISGKGGCCVVVRSEEEWRESEAGRRLVGTPVVEIARIGDGQPEPMRPIGNVGEGRPLNGVRVLNNTHVIAGPMAARMAAEFGADVLVISSPAHRDPFGMVVETAIGKRAAWV